MRCEMLPKARRNSLKRLGPPPRVATTSTVHLSPTRESTSLTARHSSGTCRLPGNSEVPSCARRMVIYLASVFIRNQEARGSHDQVQARPHRRQQPAPIDQPPAGAGARPAPPAPPPDRPP